MNKLDFYELVLQHVTMFMDQFKVTITTTLNLEEFSITLVNQQAPALSKTLTCKDPQNDEHQKAFLAELGDMQVQLFRDRQNNIRHGLRTALIHMKPGAIEALQNMPAEELQQLIDEELNRRK